MKTVRDFWFDLPIRFKGAAVVFIPALFFGVFIILPTVRLITENTYLERVIQYPEVSRKVGDLYAAVSSAEAAALGFAASRRSAFRQDYGNALEEVAELRRHQVTRIVRDRRVQPPRKEPIEKLLPARIVKLLEERLQLLREEMALLDTGSRQSNKTRHDRLLVDGRRKMEALRKHVHVFISHQDSELLAAKEDAREARRTSFRRIMWAGVIGVVGALFWSLFFHTAISSRLSALKRNADRIGRGEEPLPFPTGRDEIYWVHEHMTKMATDIAGTKARLAEARDQALAASRAKSDFLATMSHEIRTPMSAIIGMADLLSETSLTEQQRDYCRRLSAASETLLSLLNDVLDMAKVEAGHLELRERSFDVRGLVARTVSIFALAAQEKGVELTSSVAEDVPGKLIGDEDRVRQILFNLIGNAVKFTSQGRIRVCVSADPSGEAGCLLFSVSDTGIGVPRDKQEAIFGSFVQGDSSTTRQYGGTGLGLAICRRLVELMGGRIWLDSEVNQGSTFSFTVSFGIPKETDEAAPGSTTAVPLDHAEDGAPRAPLRILLAEDAPENQALVLAFLADTPYQIDVAENGAAAVEKFTSGGYELVLMDIQMPGMDGYSAARAIREWERVRGAKPVPIIALTANAFKEDEQRSLEAGCTAHLTKPIRKPRLLQAIEELAKEPAPRHPGRLPEERPVASVDASLKELIPAYLENRSKDVETLLRALENGDFSGIRSLAHKIKGSGGGYGFDRITTIGAAMEQAAAEADRGAIERAIAELRQYVARVEIVYNS